MSNYRALETLITLCRLLPRGWYQREMVALSRQKVVAHRVPSMKTWALCIHDIAKFSMGLFNRLMSEINLVYQYLYSSPIPQPLSLQIL